MSNELTSAERELSRTASQRLGFSVIVYRDGQWICQPNGTRLNGYGDTPQEAEADCKARNAPKVTKEMQTGLGWKR